LPFLRNSLTGLRLFPKGSRKRDAFIRARDARATQSRDHTLVILRPAARSCRNPWPHIPGTFLRASGRSQIWRDKFAVAPFRTADDALMRRVGPESSACRLRPENAPAAPIHHTKSRRDRTVAVLTAPMLPAESFPRLRLPPNVAWKCNRARADNWHGRTSKCIARSLHSTSMEFHRRKIDEER